MLCSLEEVIGCAVIGEDGDVGKTSNFLFEDQSWRIRYLIVDLGGWISRKQVVLAVSAIEKPDWKSKTFHVRLTRDQVRHSPDVDTVRPVSRQQEIAMSQYFGWPSYWDTPSSEIPPVPIAIGQEFPVPGGGDPHLRSFEYVAGYDVWAQDHRVGRLDDFIVDQDCWHIGYLDVKTDGWLHGRSVLVPTRWVSSISWANHRVNLNQSLH